jgi:hypothetical protein
MDGEGPSSAPSSAPDPVVARRDRIVTGVITTLVVLGIGGAVFGSWYDERSRVAHEPRLRG